MAWPSSPLPRWRRWRSIRSARGTIIQGFGDVGCACRARTSRPRGTDRRRLWTMPAACYNPKGLVAREARRSHAALRRRPRGLLDRGSDGAHRRFLEQPCDVLAPCAVERVIDAEHRRGACAAAILAEGANGPTTPEADRVLARAQRRDLRHPGHPLQRRRRDRQLFRMGAGSAAILLVHATR